MHKKGYLKDTLVAFWAALVYSSGIRVSGIKIKRVEENKHRFVCPQGSFVISEAGSFSFAI